MVEVLFIANLNADKIYIDMKYLPTCNITQKFYMTILNQHASTSYYKIISGFADWTITTPSYGKLGGIATKTTVGFFPIITRSVNPLAETTDVGSFTIEAYSDSGYVTKIGEATLNCTVYLEDLENWTDHTIYDFNDGTNQGWTLGSWLTVSSTKSVEQTEPGIGYSLQFTWTSHTTDWDVAISISKSLAIPNRNKVRISYYFGYSLTAVNTAVVKYLKDPLVSCDAVTVFTIPTVIAQIIAAGNLTEGWFKVSADISPWKGLTKTLLIYFLAQNRHTAHPTVPDSYTWVDRIVIAGKD